MLVGVVEKALFRLHRVVMAEYKLMILLHNLKIRFHLNYLLTTTTITTTTIIIII